MYLKSEEICKAIRQGKDVAENLAQIEPQLKHYYKERRKALQGKQISMRKRQHLTRMGCAV